MRLVHGIGKKGNLFKKVYSSSLLCIQEKCLTVYFLIVSPKEFDKQSSKTGSISPESSDELLKDVNVWEEENDECNMSPSDVKVDLSQTLV